MTSSKRPMPETDENESLRKYKKTIYTTAGFTNDEIKLQFDNGTELFVSKGLLMHASPVFEKMLKSECKESKTQTILLKGKEYEDMLELLKLIDPMAPYDITDQNVYQVFPLVHEYKIDRLVKECETVIQKYVQRAETPPLHGQQIVKNVRKCMQFLKLADSYSLSSVLSAVLAELVNHKFRSYRDLDEYKTLSETSKNKLMTMRLDKFD